MMLKHRCAALIIFHDTETPPCSTVHFSDVETPPKNTGHCFPDTETPLFGTFHFFPVTEASHHPHHSHSRNNSVQHLFRFFPFLCCNTIRSNLSISPVAETPIVSNFSPVSPMLKHHCSAFFIPFPSSFSPSIIDETIPSSNCFASLLLKHHLPATLHHSSTLLKHHFPAIVHHSSMMLKHHRSAPSDFLPILKHQLSAVLHL
jgi:hypothetical protein